MTKINRFSLILILVYFIISCSQLLYAENGNANSENEPIKANISTLEDIEPVTLSLYTTLTLAKENNLSIAIKKDKVNESQLKLDEVKNKRLFLFFKFTNSNALEQSANYSIEASEANLKATINNVLADASRKYYNVLQALYAKQVAKEFLKKGENSLAENNKLLEEGAATKFEVKQSEVFVENLKQKLLESDIAYMLSSVDLAQHINAKVLNTNIIPVECKSSEKDGEINVEPLLLIPDNILLNDSVDYALANRPELEELEYKIKSFEELNNATKNDEIKEKTIESQISQLENTLALTKNTIKTTVTQALLKLIGTKNQIEVARKKYTLSISALDQARVTRQEGYGSNKDIIDAQVNLAQAKNEYIKTIISYNLAQIDLLKELGLIEIDILIKNEPIAIPKVYKNDDHPVDDPVNVLNKALDKDSEKEAEIDKPENLE